MLILNIEESLKAFSMKYGHLVSDKPTLEFSDMVKRLRHNLIMEEVEETLHAMGFFQRNELGETIVDFMKNKQDLVEIADGIADAVYVLVGTAIAYGIPFNRVFTEVHRSNMTKTAAKVEAGQKYGTKTPKGPDFISPDITTILFHPEERTALEMLHDPR